MKRFVVLGLLAAVGVAHAAGTVQVSFVEPEKFSDARDRTYRVDDNLKVLEKMVSEAACPYVGDGQTLKIEVVDVDLAGELRPGARGWDLRVLRGRADWPRISLRWSLEGAGLAVPRSGQAVIQDMAYLQRVAPPLADKHLVYERRMLNDWFRGQFGDKAAGGVS